MGSNSIRLLIGTVRDGRITPVLYERRATRLASGLSSTGRLGDEAMSHTLDAVEAFKRICQTHKVGSIDAAATSALRQASNSAEFLSLVKARTGVDVTVISGEAEAGLTALGVVMALDINGPALIVDIGGGSTEVVHWHEGRIARALSEPVGAVGLIERNIKSDPPAMAELAALRAECVRAAMKFRGLISEKPSSALIGTAGTMTTIAAIDLGLDVCEHGRVHGHEVAIDRLRAIEARLAGMSLYGRAQIKGLEPQRADLIMAGITLTIAIMEVFSYKRLVVSDAGLLEGLLISGSQGVEKSAL